MRVAVAFFAYNRPTHTKRCLQSLLANPALRDVSLFTYADGPRGDCGLDAQAALKETREVIRRLCSPVTTNIHEFRDNQGVERIVVGSITELLASFDAVIVIEDDLSLSSHFLDFMLDGLSMYRDSPEVYAVSGYMWPTRMKLPETLFLPVPHYWGWGTWPRAWQCYIRDPGELAAELSRTGLVDDWNSLSVFRYDNFELLELHSKRRFQLWDVVWAGSVVLHRGLTLYPGKTLVQNHGFDNSGLHCRSDIGYQFSGQPLAESRPEVFRQRIRMLADSVLLHQETRRLLVNR